MPIAKKILMQIAEKVIGQLTKFRLIKNLAAERSEVPAQVHPAT
jgi:hypothetical protein